MADTKADILIVDADALSWDLLDDALRRRGYGISTAPDCASALAELQCDDYQLVIADHDLSRSGGLDLLNLIRRRHPDVATIVTTSSGSVEEAVHAIKAGAADYLTRPIAESTLISAVEQALKDQVTTENATTLSGDGETQHTLRSILGQDYKMLRIIDVVETVADANITVLLTGQSGTGKSLIARAIHGSSARRTKPFVEVSCGALSESLLESELFGHVKGSFTGALADKPGKFKAAHGGTIFLDEIASASPALQVKLLRVLQDRRFEPLGSNLTEAVDVRVILATNVDLREAVDAGRFREDLYYRINVVNIEAPRLVDRKADIPLLARHFLDEHGSHGGRDISNISPETMRILQGYDWPGNVRELENVIARALVFAKGPTIDPHDLPPHILDTVQIRDQDEGFHCQSLCQALAEPEKQIIESALAANNWSRKATADELRIDRTTLYKKMKRHGLQGEPLVRR